MAKKQLGQILIENGIITQKQLDTTLANQKEQKGKYLGQLLMEMGISPHKINDILDLHHLRRPVGQILRDSNFISESQLEEALEEQTTNYRPLAKILMDMGYISKERYLETLSKHFNIPIISLKEQTLSVSLQKVLGQKFTLTNKIIVLEDTPEAVKIAISEPSRMFLNELRSYLPAQKNTEFYLSDPFELEDSLRKIYSLEEYGAVNGKKLVISQQVSEKSKRSSYYTEELQTKRAIRLLDYILENAIENNASDIHLEAREFGGLVKLRIDGELDFLEMPEYFNEEYYSVISRIKVLTGSMKIDEKVVPQDGSFRAEYRLENRKKVVDFRVSTINSNYGESITIRLLDQENAKVSLLELGFSEDIYTRFRELIKHHEGMILVTGPTGSGKTTTLYASLNALLDPRKKILSIEDPVEYIYKDFVVQTEVNKVKHVDYATLLKAFLRQDPDIIMVGEIRDEETANTAIRAVQTGHLLISTLHTIDTTKSISRLFELNINPVTFLSNTRGIMGQRLVRKLCPDCMEEYDPDPETIKKYFNGLSINFPFVRGRGCNSCDYQGFKGRTVLNELWIISDEELSKVDNFSDAIEVRKNALFHGLETFYMDGIKKLKNRQTTLEQLVKAVPNIETERDLYFCLLHNKSVTHFEPQTVGLLC